MLTKSFQSLLCCLQVISQLLIEIFCLILTTKVSEVNCTSQTFLLFTATVLKGKKIYCSKGSVIQSLKQTNKAKGHVQTNQKQFSLLSVKLKMVQIGYTLDHAVAGSFYCEEKEQKKKKKTDLFPRAAVGTQFNRRKVDPGRQPEKRTQKQRGLVFCNGFHGPESLFWQKINVKMSNFFVFLSKNLDSIHC